MIHYILIIVVLKCLDLTLKVIYIYVCVFVCVCSNDPLVTTNFSVALEVFGDLKTG
jgi:hypothetical protein